MKSQNWIWQPPVVAACVLWAAAAQAETVVAQATAAEALPSTVVTARGFKESAQTQSQAVRVITAQDIAQSGARDVVQALHRVLGLLPIKQDLAGAGSAHIDLRGYGDAAWSNQVVIVDGLRMNEGDMSYPLLGSLPIDSIERIEVVRGASSVLYGEGATAGAIVITTKAGAGIARRNGGRVQLGVGNRGQRELAANATFANASGFSMDVAAQKRKVDNERRNFKTDEESLNVSAQWSNDWLRVGGNVGQFKTDSGLPGSLTAAQYADNPWQTNRPDDRGSQKTQQHGLFAQAQLGDWELAGNMNWRDKASKVDLFGKQVFDLDAKNSHLRARHTWQQSDYRNALSLGYEQSDWDLNVKERWDAPRRAEANNKAWYIKDDVSLLASGTHLSAGWRSQRMRKSDTQLAEPIRQREHAWELGLRQELGSDWSVFARTAQGLRGANADEYNYTMPSVTLKPQTSRDVELGLNWQHAGSSVELRSYRSRVNNEIGFDATANGGWGANVNFDPLTRKGLEVDGEWAATEALKLKANVVWRSAKFTAGPFSGLEVPRVAKRNVSLAADWQLSPEHGVHGRVNWVSKQQANEANDCRIPAYATVDVGYRYSRGAWGLDANFDNVGDKRYYNWAYGCEGHRPTSIYPEAGRRLGLNVSYKW